MIPYILSFVLIILLVAQHFECRKLKRRIALLESEAAEKSSLSIPQEIHPEGMSETAPSVKQEENGPYKLLIIEDHKDIQLFLKVLFGHEYTLSIAGNGEEGLKKAQEVMPDLIITDIMMPVMDGFECTRLLKENLTTCHIPIIQLTALSDDNNAVKGMELGADDYITKPFSPEVLKTKVKRLIQGRMELKEFYTRLLLPAEPEAIGNMPGKENTEGNLEMQDPFIARLFQIVNDNISNKDLTVKKLAEELNISQPTLYRKVKQQTSFSVMEIIRSARLKKASEMLKNHTYSIPEVAEAVGYNDLFTFRKHFVEFYGIKPSIFGRDAE